MTNKENGNIPFLDVQVREPSNGLMISRYTNPTHSERYLNFFIYINIIFKELKSKCIKSPNFTIRSPENNCKFRAMETLLNSNF